MKDIKGTMKVLRENETSYISNTDLRVLAELGGLEARWGLPRDQGSNIKVKQVPAWLEIVNSLFSGFLCAIALS